MSIAYLVCVSVAYLVFVCVCVAYLVFVCVSVAYLVFVSVVTCCLSDVFGCHPCHFSILRYVINI